MKYATKDIASTIVVIKGLAITAGSNPILLAAIGSIQPTIFAIITVITKVKEKYPNFLIYSGDDKYTLDMLKLGADGVISVLSHVFGKDLKELIEDYNNGIENESLDKYIKELSDILFCETNPIPIKYVLSKKGYSSMYLRLPLIDLSKDKRHNIDIILNL